MSVRAVAEGLGLSHGALNRRLGGNGKWEIFDLDAPLDADTHIEEMTDLIMRGLTR